MRTQPSATSPREPAYSLAVGFGRFLFGAVLRLKPVVSGIERIPTSGPAVLAITHFGYADFALVEWVTWLHNRRRVRFLAMKGAFDKPVVGWLLRSMRHISVDKAAGSAAYELAVDALRRGELLGVFPEAGVSASFTVRELKSGSARMAAEAGVPIIPVVVWGGQLLRTKGQPPRLREAFRAPIRIAVGEPLVATPTDDPVRVTEDLRERMQSLLDDAQATYPLPGTGQWWQPKHLGGSAPSPEDAAVAEAERQQHRAAERERKTASR
jgi:1-acyl-sn-glycerol-3-phosphate acyltransferase